MRVNNTGVIVAGTSLQLVGVISQDWIHYAVGPHGYTLRGSYTIPTGRIGVLTGYDLHWRRVSAATTVGTAMQTIMVTVPGVGESRITLAFRRTNTVGDYINKYDVLNLTFPAGSVLQYFTQDNSDGGTCDYIATISVMLYKESR